MQKAGELYCSPMYTLLIHLMYGENQRVASRHLATFCCV